MIHSSLLTLLLTAVAPLNLQAGDWPNWRGPHWDGSSDEKGLPGKISMTENILWKAAVPGPAASSPVVSGGKVFLTTAESGKKVLTALCFNAADGTLLWSKQIGTGYSSDGSSNFANPSPVTDGRVVVFHFATGDTAAFDFEGKELWKRNLQTDYGSWTIQWTPASSPVITHGKLIFQVLQRDTAFEFQGVQKGKAGSTNESYLLALDPMTGKEIWKQTRPSQASAESREAFSTPMPWTCNGRDELLVSGGDDLTGHDPATGRELWRWGTYNPTRISHYRLVPGPVAGNNTVIICGPKREPVFAIKGGLSGTLKDSDLAWTSSNETNSKHVSSDVSTPLFYRGRFYILNSDRKEIFAVDPVTGKLHWSCRLDSQKIESSPAAGDGKIYFQDMSGKLFILPADAPDGSEVQPLSSATLSEDVQKDIRSSIALADGRVFIRNGTHLICAGIKADNK